MNPKSNTKHFGIWGNTDKEKFWNLLNPILEWSKKNSLVPYVTTRIADNLPNEFSFSPKIIKTADDFDKLDFLIALGGDGTILSAARAVGSRKTPIVGIRLGELGFLAEVTVDDMFKRLNQINEGDFSVNHRMVIKATLSRNGEQKTFFALNDFVVDRGKSQRIINLELYAGDNFISSYKSDGLIISTPTGSTGYSLSCGGPILTPNNKNLLITPISPHNLGLRSLIISDKSKIKLKIENQKYNFLVSMDSRSYTFKGEQEFIVEKSKFYVNLIHPNNYDFFETLRKKLNWGFDLRN